MKGPFTDAYVTAGTERETRLEIRELADWLDEAGFERAVIFPEDRECVVENQKGNHRILDWAGQLPGRIVPGFTINPWWGMRAVDWAGEAIRSRTRILMVDPAVQGFHLLDPLAAWLWDWCRETGTPVHVRVSPAANSTPIPGVKLARRNPSIRWLLGGSGVTDYSYETAAVLEDLPGNVWLDTSYARPSGLALLLDRVPADRLVFSSAAPRQNLVHEARRVALATPKNRHADLFGGSMSAFLA